jgi:aminoglycoside phosphotransferase (APT) family kinase protein
MLNEEEQGRLARFLAEALGAGAVSITAIKRFHGGASRETYGLDVMVDSTPRGLIVRRDPADSLIDTERAVEFAAYQSCEGSGVPAPRAIALVEDDVILGAPFFVMERIDGGEAGSPFDPATYGDHRASVGRAFFTNLGRIHAIDAMTSPLAAVLPPPEPQECWRVALDYWAGECRTDALEPQPVVEAAIRWLYRNPPPPPARRVIVHGDYRTGNVLHDGAGGINAVLDWEMAHIGDPHEDLGWALDALWNATPEKTGAGLILREEAIALWEAASGLMFDPHAFRWWEVFASVKGMGIWISSAKAGSDGANTDPILAFSGLYPMVRSNRNLVTLMRERMAA